MSYIVPFLFKFHYETQEIKIIEYQTDYLMLIFLNLSFNIVNQLSAFFFCLFDSIKILNEFNFLLIIFYQLNFLFNIFLKF